MLVFPGGVDVHTHVAGSALGFARGLLPELQRSAPVLARTADRPGGVGGLLPTSVATGCLYAGMGWTTVNEAAMPVISARQTHRELGETPVVDASCLVLLANNELLLDLLAAGETERARHLVGWLIWAAKAWGVKAVNPGGVSAWKSGRNAAGLHAPLEGRDRLTPAGIIAALAGIVDGLGLPHAVHLHCNDLGMPGNAVTTIETMRVLDGRRAHLAHLQFHAYGGDGWPAMRSASMEVMEAFERYPLLTADAGAVLFGDAVTITADGPWQHMLYQLTGRKWGNLDVEHETGCGVVPYVYRDRHLVNAVQWAVGLELLLLSRDPWRLFLTTDHPNGGAFWRYGEIVQLLMDAEYRKAEVGRLPAEARSRIVLSDLDREYTLSEIAVVTSAGPARALGLHDKGHLGPGAEADVAIYPAKPGVDGRLFGCPRYVIKGGSLVVEDGEIRTLTRGRELVVRPAFDETIEAYLRPRFEALYTMSFDNYPVPLERLRAVEIRELGARA
jgi:formylmethanofuran dehydrogenase subunit A